MRSHWGITRGTHSPTPQWTPVVQAIAGRYSSGRDVRIVHLWAQDENSHERWLARTWVRGIACLCAIAGCGARSAHDGASTHGDPVPPTERSPATAAPTNPGGTDDESGVSGVVRGQPEFGESDRSPVGSPVPSSDVTVGDDEREGTNTNEPHGCSEVQLVSVLAPAMAFQGELAESTPYQHPDPSSFAMAEFFPNGLMYPVREIEGVFVEVPENLAGQRAVAALWAESADDVYLALPGTTSVVHWLQGEWREESLFDTAGAPTSDSLTAITGDGAGRLWATGKRLYERIDPGQWQAVDMPADIYPLRDAWVGPDGFGVAIGEAVFTTFDGGQTWNDDTRSVGFIADGMAERREFRQVRGQGDAAAIVTQKGELLLRVNQRWEASYLDAHAVGFDANRLFVASERALLVEGEVAWEAYPATRGGWGGKGGGYYRLEQLFSTKTGHVFTTGNFEGVYHRYPDGSVEFHPIPDLVAGIWANDETLLLGADGWPTGFWRYNFGEGRAGGGARVAAASAEDREMLPSETQARTYAPHFEAPACAERMLEVGGTGVVTTVSASERFEPILGCMASFERLILRSYGFRAGASGTYQFVLEELDDEGDPPGNSHPTLELRSHCDGEVMVTGPRFFADLREGQQVVVDVVEVARNVQNIDEVTLRVRAL